MYINIKITTGIEYAYALAPEGVRLEHFQLQLNTFAFGKWVRIILNYKKLL